MSIAEKEDSGSYDELIFRRGLSEVYLLMDFISGRSDAHIWNLDINIPQRGDSGEPAKAFDLYQRISKMRYPPDPSDRDEKAYNATVLLYIKDRLSSIAAPARGMTIAYTYMFLADAIRDGQTKASVAAQAYPGLATSAKRLRRKRNWVGWGGSVLFILAVLLLCWTVYGSVVIKRFEEDRLTSLDLAKQIYTQVLPDKAHIADPGLIGDAAHICLKENYEKLAPAAQELCANWSYYQARYDKSIADTGYFANGIFVSRMLIYFFPIATVNATPAAVPANAAKNASSASASRPEDFRQEDVQSVGLVLSVYSTYVLPFMFGLVGTMAAFLRDIGTKTSLSTLSPRDDSLAYVRLLLGAIAGIAVGLFYSPTDSAQQVASGAGIMTLSAPAIAFLAGYAADVFFTLLDSLSSQVFRMGSSASSSK